MKPLKTIFIFCLFILGCVYAQYIPWVLGALALIVIWNLFNRELYISQGSKQRKRKTAVFFLLHLMLLLTAQLTDQAYVYFGFFLLSMALYLYKIRFGYHLLFYILLLSHAGIYFSSLFILIASGMTVWMVFSFILILLDQKKIHLLQTKLSVFERESRSYLQETEKDLISIEQKRITQAVERINQEKEQFHNLVQMLFEIFIPNTCAFYAYEPCEDIFILKAYQSQEKDFEKQSFMPNEGIFRLVTTQKKTMQVHQNAIPGLLYYKNTKQMQTVLVCPLVYDERLYGVVLLDHAKDKNYNKYEISIVERVCQHFYNILADSKTLALYEHLKEEFTSFYQASSSLNRAFYLQEVLETLLHMTKSVAPYDWGSVVLYNKDLGKNMVVLDSEQDEFGLVGKTFSQSYQRGSVSWVIDQMKPLHYNNFIKKYRHTHLFHKKMKLPNMFESVFILPLYVQEEKIGCILLMSEKNFFFTRVIQNMLEVLAFQASIAIKNAISVAHLEKLATTDGLTGLVNHRTFQEEFSQEIQRAERFKQELSIMLVDLDYFKKINDEYGHPAGDFILQKTSAFLQDQVRTTDVVARYGGEEFAVILPNTSSNDANRLAKRMIQKIHDQKWEYEKIHIPITFSIGIASMPEHGKQKNVIIEHADQALYQAKNNGRNRACVFDKRSLISDTEEKEDMLIANMERQVRS